MSGHRKAIKRPPGKNTEFKKEGEVTKVYHANMYFGQYKPVEGGFKWQNWLVDRFQNQYTEGIVKTEREALAKLGFFLKQTGER